MNRQIINKQNQEAFKRRQHHLLNEFKSFCFRFQRSKTFKNIQSSKRSKCSKRSKRSKGSKRTRRCQSSKLPQTKETHFKISKPEKINIKPFKLKFKQRIAQQEISKKRDFFFATENFLQNNKGKKSLESKPRCLKQAEWDNTPLFVKYNPGLLDLLVLLDETGLQTGL